MITSRQIYETKGRQFDTAQQAFRHREDLIEQFFRGVPGFQDIPARQKIAFIEYILNQRHNLRDLLNFDIPRDSND